MSPDPPQMCDVELKFRTVLAAPPERVFAAITRAEHLTHWLCDAAESDPRMGGRLALTWRRPGASAEPFVAEWVTFEAPAACAFSGGQSEHPNGHGGRIDWALEAADGGTLLKTRHSMPPHLDYAPVAQRYTLAWPRALDRLAEYLAGPR